MSEGTEVPVSGVTSLEHTADVALEVEAPDERELFRRSALGMMYLLLERVPDDERESRRLEVSSQDAPGLLREWLRELLYWHETEGFAIASCRFERLDVPEGGGSADPGTEFRLEATVRGGPVEGQPVREIKGVTLHGLAAERRDDGWYGRVIFDV